MRLNRRPYPRRAPTRRGAFVSRSSNPAQFCLPLVSPSTSCRAGICARPRPSLGAFLYHPGSETFGPSSQDRAPAAGALLSPNCALPTSSPSCRAGYRQDRGDERSRVMRIARSDLWRDVRSWDVGRHHGRAAVRRPARNDWTPGQRLEVFLQQTLGGASGGSEGQRG
jgi:hypothetical protein